MKVPLFPCLVCFALLCGDGAAQEPNEKAARYWEPLLKRPGSGPLFDRFVDAWLDTDTLENLSKYLTARVKADDTTAHRLLLAVYWSRQGEPVKALEQFRAALAKEPGSADIWYQKAVVEARTLDFDSAVASLHKALEAKPNAALSLQAGQLLGRLLARSGRTDEALKVWEDLIAARPQDDELREDVLELQIAEGLHAAALATAAALVDSARDPYQKILRRLRLGDVHDRAGARDKALETYASCLADTGADSWLEKEITAQIEKLFRREDDLAGLKNFYAKLLERDGRRLSLRRAQTRLMVEMNETEAAVTAGRELLALAPGDQSVREEFIALLAGARKLPEAIAQLEALRKQSPGDPELILRLATLQNESGNKPAVILLVREFLKVSGDEGARLRASGLLERCGLADEAVAVLREGGASPALRQSMASILHKSDKKDEALAEWKRLATGGTSTVLEAARAMTTHGESEAAWQLLKDHASQAEGDAPFLTALCQAAERTDHAADALPFVRKLVARAALPAELESAVDLALRLVRKTDALEALTSEVQTSAASASDFALLAALREEKRDSAGAEAALKQAEAASPELAAVLLVRVYAQRGDYVQAAKAMDRLIASPGGRKAHHVQSLADLWLRAGHTEEALRATREWRQLAPGSTAPVLAEARLLESAGREAESLDVLRRAAGQFENNEDVRGQLASAYRDSGRTTDALRIYASLYESATDLSAKMRWMQPWAQTAEEAGRTQELVEQFEERRRASRESIVPLLALAEIHRAGGSYEGRRKALTEAARLKRNDPELALEIARLEAREDNLTAAIQTLRMALPNDQSGAVRHELVLALLRSGERDEGLRLLAEGNSATRNDPGAIESVAANLMARDSAETALIFLTPHLTAHPNDYRLQLLAAQLEDDQPGSAVPRLLHVLAQRTELPEARLGGIAKAVVSNDEEDELMMMMRQIAPPRAAEFYAVVAAAQQLDRRTNQQRGGSQSQPAVNLPDNIESARFAAAALLLQLAEDALPDDKAAGLIADMERAGLPSAGLIHGIGLSVGDDLFDHEASVRLFELSTEKPEDDTLLALASFGQLFDWQGDGMPELAGRAWKRFGRERTSLALLAALPAAGLTDQPAAWEQEALRAAESVPKPDPLLLLAAMRVAGLPWDENKRPDLRPEVTKRMHALLQRWYGGTEFRGPLMSQIGGMIFATLIDGFGEGGDAAAFAALLDAEASRASGSRVFSFQGRNQRAGEVAQPLGFPPRALPLGLPPMVLTVLAADDEAPVSPTQLKEDDLRAAAQHVKHPVVKILLLLRAGDEDAAGKLIESRLAAPEPEAVSYLLAAAWAERQSDFTRAAELARKALFLPLSREARKVLDAAFLSWAESDRGNEPVVAAAREAALRLRRDVLTPEARQRLAAAMDGLGLTAEADKLAKQDSAGTVTGGGVTTPGYSGRSATPAAGTQSARLLAAGRKEEAVPLLARELRTFAQQALKEDGWGTTVRGFEEWHSTVKQHALATAVMKSLVPADDDPTKLALYGAALDLTGDHTPAVEVFRKAMTSGSTEPGVKARLMRRIAAGDPTEAARLLSEVPAASRDVAFSMLLPRNEYDSYGMRAGRQRLLYRDPDGSGGRALQLLTDAAEVLEAFLQRATPEEIATAHWIEEALPALSQAAHIDGVWKAPALHAKQWEIPEDINVRDPFRPAGERRARPQGESEARRRIAERASLVDGLVQRLTATPGTACTAWQAMRRRSHHDDDSPMPPQLFAAGMECVRRDLSVPKPDKPAHRAQPVWADVFLRLLPDAVRTDRMPELESKLLPEIRRVAKGKTMESIEQSWTLHRCPPEEFAGKAKEIAARMRGASWKEILEAAVVRRLGTETVDEFVKWLETKIGGHADVSEARDAFAVAARLVFDRKGRAGFEEWLRTVWTRLAGTRDERTKAMSTMDEDGDFQGRRSAAIQWMSWLTIQTWREWPLAFTALRVWEQEYMECVPETRRSRLWQNSRDFSSLQQQLALLIEEERTTKVIDFLNESPFAGGAADFRSYGGAEGLFGIVVEVLKSAGTSVQMRTGLMAAPDKLTFGQSLLAAGIARDRRTATANGIARWQTDIAALPMPQRDEILNILRPWVGIEERIGGQHDPFATTDELRAVVANSALPTGLTPEGEAFYRWLQKIRDEERLSGLDGEVSKFLDPKKLRELRNAGLFEMDNTTRTLLESLIKADSPRAWEFVEKVREPAAQSTRDPNRNPLGEALRGIIDDGQSSPDQSFPIALVLHAAAAPGGQPLPVGWQMYAQFKEAGESFGNAQRDPVARLKIMADRLGVYVRENETALLLPVLSEAIGVETLNTMTVEQNCEAVLEWTRTAGRNHARQDIVREIAAAAQLVLNAHRRDADPDTPPVTEEAKLPPEQRHYLAALRDDRLHVCGRLTLAAMLAEGDPWQVDDALVREAVTLFERVVQSRAVVPPWQEVMVMELLALRGRSVPADLAARVLQSAQSGRSLNRNGDDGTSQRGIRAALQLALSSGDAATAARIVRACGDAFDQSFLCLLAREGTPDLMRTLLRHGRHGLFEPSSIEGPLQAEPPGTAELDKAIASVEHEDLRFMARLAVRSIRLQDRNDPAPSEAGRLAELAALAREFPAITFKEVAMRERALEWLALEPASAAIVAPFIRESLEGIPISTIGVLRDRKAQERKKALYYSLLSDAAAKGEFAMLEGALAEVTLMAPDERGSEGGPWLASECLKAAATGLLRDWQTKPEVLARGCALFRTIVGKADFPDKSGDWERAAQFTGLLHAMADKTEELEAWWKQLPVPVRERLSAGTVDSALFRSASFRGQYAFAVPDFLRGGVKAEAAALRDRVFLRYAATPLFGMGRDAMEGFRYGGWGTVEDALRLEEQWCSAAPRGGRTAQRFVEYYDARRDYERCLAAADRGLTASGPGRSGLAGSLTAWKLFSLYRLDRAGVGLDLFLAAARIAPAPEEDAPAEAQPAENTDAEAKRTWDNCAYWVSVGPAKKNGSLAETIKVAAVLYEEAKDDAAFRTRLELAGVHAAETLAGQKRLTEAHAAAAFALKARAFAERAGAKPPLDLKSRAEAVLGGALPDKPLVARNAAWRWLESAAEAGEAWRSASFDDSTWKSGSGPFGFGDDGLTTTISNKAADGSLLISWPFRAEFDVADPAMVKILTLNLRVDDGAIVWLNGKEAGRRNMPSGAITFQTLAPRPINQNEEGRLDPMVLDPQLLIKGRNVMAVRLHQQRPDSSDAAFHTELLQATATGPAAAGPDHAIQPLAPLLKEWPEELRKEFQ